MRYSFDDPAADSTPATQYFEILGNRAIYHDGWVAACFHGRVPWIRTARRVRRHRTWELYRIADDFSQGMDLAEQHPDKLAELKALFDAEARSTTSTRSATQQWPARCPPTGRACSAIAARYLLRRACAHARNGDTSLKNTSFELRARFRSRRAAHKAW